MSTDAQPRHAPLRRTLPVVVRAVAREHSSSLVARLARANHLPYRVLHDLVRTDDRAGTVDLAQLATLSGFRHDLIDQLVVTDPPTRWHLLMSACQFCTAQRGATDPIIISAQPHEQICRKHRRWLARRGASSDEEFDLHAVPEVLATNRLHRRLLHRRDPATVQDAFGVASRIAFRWTARGDWPGHRNRRLGAFYDLNRWALGEHHPLMRLVNYPETVKLTELLTDPSVAGRQVWHTEAGLERFYAQVRHRLDIPFQVSEAHDPLLRFLHQMRLTARDLPQLQAMNVARPLDVLWNS